MVAACVGFTAIALARSQLTVPHGWTVWSALLVTGIFASAFAFVIQTWAQRRTSATRAALAFAAEPVFAAFFGYLLAGDRLGAVGWSGCALILCGIVISEPAAARVFRSAVRREPVQPPVSRCEGRECGRCGRSRLDSDCVCIAIGPTDGSEGSCRVDRLDDVLQDVSEVAGALPADRPAYLLDRRNAVESMSSIPRP
jgi:uncharacterized membrane protein